MVIRSVLYRIVTAIGLAGVLAASVAAPAGAAPAPSNGCAAVELIAVRGSAEPYPAEHPHIGYTEVPVVDAVVRDAAATVNSYGIDYTDIPYDPKNPGPYDDSMKDGRQKLAARLSQRADACPDQKFALMGYSQGAQVVGDALAGNNRGTPEISSTLGAKVVAVALYGDPDFVAGEPFDRGSPKPGVSGVAARPKGALDTYADRIASYCNGDDIYCQTGVADGSGGHWDYAKYDSEAASFVVSLLPKPAASTPTPVVRRIKGLAGKCVDVNNRSTANGTAIQLYSCNGTPAQDWTVGTDGTLRALGKCMDVTAAGTTSGTRVQLYECNGTGAQAWTLNSAKEVVNTHSGKCLDDYASSTTDGARLVIWKCHGRANQQWTLAS
jgi:hypothetical protein